MIIFNDVMDPGIDLINNQGYMIPDYLTIDVIKTITLDDHLNPAKLDPYTLYIYPLTILLIAITKESKIILLLFG